jgi:hypothetical protein
MQNSLNDKQSKMLEKTKEKIALFTLIITIIIVFNFGVLDVDLDILLKLLM